MIELIGIVIGVAGLVLTAVGLFRTATRSREGVSTHGRERLILSDDAKAVLTRMQSDPTQEGIFRLIRVLGPSAPSLVCVYHTEIDIEVTNRVMSELEDKGLVTIEPDLHDDKVTLTSRGWRLNPGTGETDKVG